MQNNATQSRLSDEERRDFLKVLGVVGSAAAGSATLDDVREAVTAQPAEELAPIGEAIASDLAGELDAGVLASGQAAVAEAAATLPSVIEAGVPADDVAPRNDFEQVAEPGRPIYDHLAEVGFFESTTEHLPAFTPEYIESSVKRFVAGEELARPLRDLDFTGQEALDLVGTVITHRERIGDRHWISTEMLEREDIESIFEHVPPMTKATAGGVLLWLEDLDQHFWKNAILVSDEIYRDAIWDARGMAAGFQLMVEGARRVAEDPDATSAGDLGAMLTSGFALQTIAQNLLAEDAYWITEEERARQDERTIRLPGSD